MVSNDSKYNMNGFLLMLMVGGVCLFCPLVYSSSFANRSGSAQDLGRADAGAVSSAVDASTAFSNPAGLSELKNKQIIISSFYKKHHPKLYNPRGTDNSGNFILGERISKQKSSFANFAVFAAIPVNSSWAAGFSINSPFAVNTKSRDSDFSRYFASESKISTMNLSPSVAYRLDDSFMLGLGLDLLYIKSEFSSAVKSLAEGYVINKNAKGRAYGYHVGALYKPSASMNIGLSYHSKLTPRIKGDVAVSNFDIPAPTTFTARIALPSRLAYGISYQNNNFWRTMAEIEWTHWSRFKNLTLSYASTSKILTEDYYYKNTYRLSFGAEYKYTRNLMLRSGIAYDKSPTNSAFKTVRFASSDQICLAFGAKYELARNLIFDAGYAHSFFKKLSLRQRGVGNNDLRTLDGNYRNSTDIVAMQLTWNFV